MTMLPTITTLRITGIKLVRQPRCPNCRAAVSQVPGRIQRSGQI